MSALASMKLAGAVSLALIANRMDLVHKTVGDAAIGVTRTFDPEGFTAPGVARWVDRSGGIAIGYPSVTLRVRPPNKASRIYRVSANVVLPSLEVASPSTATGFTPAPQVAYSHMFSGEWLLPERGLAWERQALLDLVMSLHMATITASDGAPSDATVSPLRNAIENFDAPWG
jgi:hypothetical protein